MPRSFKPLLQGLDSESCHVLPSRAPIVFAVVDLGLLTPPRHELVGESLR